MAALLEPRTHPARQQGGSYHPFSQHRRPQTSRQPLPPPPLCPTRQRVTKPPSRTSSPTNKQAPTQQLSELRLQFTAQVLLQPSAQTRANNCNTMFSAYDSSNIGRTTTTSTRTTTYNKETLSTQKRAPATH